MKHDSCHYTSLHSVSTAYRKAVPQQSSIHKHLAGTIDHKHILEVFHLAHLLAVLVHRGDWLGGRIVQRLARCHVRIDGDQRMHQRPDRCIFAHLRPLRGRRKVGRLIVAVDNAHRQHGRAGQAGCAGVGRHNLHLVRVASIVVQLAGNANDTGPIVDREIIKATLLNAIPSSLPPRCDTHTQREAKIEQEDRDRKG